MRWPWQWGGRGVEDRKSSSLSIDQVVSQVKEAVRRANVVGRDGTSIAISKLDVTLQVVQDLSAGANAQWTVPVVGLGLSAKANIDTGATSTITLQLVPPMPVQGAVQALVPRVNVADDLVEAIEVIKAGVLAGATGDPPFELAEASVALSFVVTVSGGISLVASAERSKATTHTLTLTLSPHQSEVVSK